MKTKTLDERIPEASGICVKKEETLELNICNHGDDLDNTPELISIKEEAPDSKDFLCKITCHSGSQDYSAITLNINHNSNPRHNLVCYKYKRWSCGM